MMSTVQFLRRRTHAVAPHRRTARSIASVVLQSIFRAAPGAALIACMACTGSQTPHRRTLIDSRDSYDPRSLDPALSTDVPTGRVVSYVFDGLTRFTPDAQLVPDLATSWTLSPDDRTYTFHLARGVTFHDGTAFTAADVKHSFERLLNPATRSGRGWPLYPILGAQAYAASTTPSIAGLTVVNDSTITITLTQPFAIFPQMLALPVASIVPRNIPSDFGEHPIGTGPWKFVEWHHDDYLRFVRNPSYHGDISKEDSLEARIIPEASTAVAEFESSNVDIVPIPTQETHTWEDNDETRGLLRSAPSLRLIYAALNTTRGPLRDVRVRQAINYAVDTRTILQRLMNDRGTLAAGVIPPSLPGADTTRRPYVYNPTRAKQLLTEAGYPHGIDLELWCSQSDPFPRLAQTLQAYLAQANIRVKIIERDASSMREAARNGTTDIALKDWYADYPDGEDFLYPLLHSANVGPGGNVSFYRNPAFDTIVTTARQDPDTADRRRLYQRADSLAFIDAPMLYLFFYKEVYAVQPWITGFQVPSIFNGQRWTNVWITHRKQ